MAAANTLPGGGPPTSGQTNAAGGAGSISVGPQTSYDTPGLVHDVGAVQFAGLLVIMGLIWFTIPGDYHWMLSLALLLGALFYANHIADTEGRPQPLDLFKSLITGQGL